jgi:uncharacterized protein YbcI
MVDEPTRAQLERSIVQRIQTLYRDSIGQRPSKAIGQFFDEKFTLVLFETVSPAEQTLLKAGQEEFAEQLRVKLHDAIKPQLKALIEEIVRIEVITILIASDLKSGFSNITAVLADPPPVRDPQTIPKMKREKQE